LRPQKRRRFIIASHKHGKTEEREGSKAAVWQK
jgi:hypothetical protein